MASYCVWAYAEKCKAGYSEGPQTIDELGYNSLAHHHTLHEWSESQIAHKVKCIQGASDTAAQWQVDTTTQTPLNLQVPNEPRRAETRQALPICSNCDFLISATLGHAEQRWTQEIMLKIVGASTPSAPRRTPDTAYWRGCLPKHRSTTVDKNPPPIRTIKNGRLVASKSKGWGAKIQAATASNHGVMEYELTIVNLLSCWAYTGELIQFKDSSYHCSSPNLLRIYRLFVSTSQGFAAKICIVPTRPSNIEAIHRQGHRSDGFVREPVEWAAHKTWQPCNNPLLRPHEKPHIQR